MTSFDRTARQNAIWDELQAIRDIVGSGLLGPEEAGYAPVEEGDPEAADLINDWNDLVEEYEEIHTANETKG